MSLLALPTNWRLCIFNTTGSSISNAPIGLPTVHGTRVRFDSTGSAVFDTTITFFCTAQASIGNNSYVTGSTISNTSGWLGGDFWLSAFASGNASGTIQVFLEFSTDGASWPSPASANGAGGGLQIFALGFGSTTTVSTASTTRIGYFTL